MILKNKSIVALIVCCLSVELGASIRRVSTTFSGKVGQSLIGRSGMQVSALYTPQLHFGAVEAANIFGAVVVKGILGKAVWAGLGALGQEKLAIYIGKRLGKKYPFIKDGAGWISTAITAVWVLYIEKDAEDRVAQQKALEQFELLTQEMQDVQNRMDIIAHRSDLNVSQKKVLTEKLQMQFEDKLKVWLNGLPSEITKSLYEQLEHEQEELLRQKLMRGKSSWWDVWGSNEDTVTQALEELKIIIQKNKEQISHEEMMERLKSVTSGPDSQLQVRRIFNNTQRLLQEHREKDELWWKDHLDVNKSLLHESLYHGL